MTRERLAKQIFAECEKDGEPISMEDALEMADMEIKAKGFKHGAKSEETKERVEKKPRNVKISKEKQDIFDFLWEGISNYYDNPQILKNNKLISLEMNGKTFKIDLIECRK